MNLTDIKNMEPLWNGWYLEDRPLNSGQYGDVYIAHKGNEKAAVKVIFFPKERDREQLAYLPYKERKDAEKSINKSLEKSISEIEILSSLQGHGNIVSYDDHLIIREKVGGVLLIRMELLTELQDYLEENNCLNDEEFVTMLAMQMCNALEACDKKGIIHRDIKPSNIFYSDVSGSFKIGDFGISIVANDLSGQEKIGTYEYMAPEAYNKCEYNKTSDIYSLGLIMFRYMNDNRLPFIQIKNQTIKNDDREKAAQQRHQGREIPSPQYASKEFASIIKKCCAFAPEDRYQNAHQLKTAIEDMLKKKKGINSEKSIISGKTLKTTKIKQVAKQKNKKSGKVLLALLSVVLISIASLIFYSVFMDPNSSFSSWYSELLYDNSEDISSTISTSSQLTSLISDVDSNIEAIPDGDVFMVVLDSKVQISEEKLLVTAVVYGNWYLGRINIYDSNNDIVAIDLYETEIINLSDRTLIQIYFKYPQNQFQDIYRIGVEGAKKRGEDYLYAFSETFLIP